MQSSHIGTLHAACQRYGPGRLPRADRDDVGAGYAAAAAAIAAAALYGIAASLGAALGLGIDGPVNVLFAALALPFVVPAAFLVGVIGWWLLPSRTSTAGVVAGGLGALATYLVTLALVGALVTGMAVLSLSGAAPANAAAFSVGLVAAAFTITWWVTIPVGCLSGFVYVNVVDFSS